MPRHGPDFFARLDIPDLNCAAVVAHGQVGAVARPREGGHVGSVVAVSADRQHARLWSVSRGNPLVGSMQRLDVPAVRVPHVSDLAEADRDLVGNAPADQVEVIIVCEPGRIEHPIRHYRRTALSRPWRGGSRACPWCRPRRQPGADRPPRLVHVARRVRLGAARRCSVEREDARVRRGGA